MSIIGVYLSPSGIGIYIFNSDRVLPNNSIITADNQLTIPKFICFSGSNSTNVGQLKDVDRYDITERKEDPIITDRSGHGSLEVQGSGNFTSGYEGMYSCQMPDEDGDIVEFSFGIYQQRSESSTGMLLVGDHNIILIAYTSSTPSI